MMRKALSVAVHALLCQSAADVHLHDICKGASTSYGQRGVTQPIASTLSSVNLSLMQNAGNELPI